MGQDKIDVDGIIYIKKDAVIEIAEKIKSISRSPAYFDQGASYAAEILIQKINEI